MDDCCVRSFVAKGFREHFRTGPPGEQHRCETCGQRYQLQRVPAGDTETHEHYEWKAVTH